jgi:hypothetical protein
VSDLDVVVTDADADPQMLRGLRERGIDVRVAPGSAGSHGDSR